MSLDLGELALYLTVNDTSLNAGLARGEESTRRTTGVMGSLGKYGAVAFATVGTAATVLGLKTAAANEQAMISFETMLGSAEKAGAFLKQLQQFAAKTPFEFPELQTAASSLISAGIEADKVIPIMTTLGDVTSGMGTGSEGVRRATIALQQMSAAGRITGEDLNQLRDAGIPVYDLLAAATGRSKEEVVKLAQAGKLGKKDLAAMMGALETGKGLERFNGLMAKQSKSLSGMWSTMLDTIGQGTASVIVPLMPMLKQGLGGAAIAAGIAFTVLGRAARGTIATFEWLQQLIESNQTTFTVVAAIIATVVTPALIMWGVQATIAGVKNVAAWVTSGVAATVNAALSFAGATLIAAGWVLVGIQSLLGAAKVAAAWLIAIGPIALVVAAVAGIVYLIVKHWDTIKEKTRAAWDWVVNQVRKVPGMIVSFFLNFTLPGLIIKHWGTIKQAFRDGVAKAVEYVKGMPGKLLSAIGDLGGTLKDAGRQLIDGFIKGIGEKFGDVKNKLGNLTGKLTSWKGPESVDKVILRQSGNWVVDGFIYGLEQRYSNVQKSLGNLTDSIAVDLPPTSLRAMGGDGAYAGGATPAGTTINMPIYPQPGQSEESIADAAFNRLMFAMT